MEIRKGYCIMYTEEKAKEILDNFTKLLVKADNFSSSGDPNEFKQFWIALRKEGANLLGVSRYLYEMKTKDNVEKDFGHTGIM